MREVHYNGKTYRAIALPGAPEEFDDTLAGAAVRMVVASRGETSIATFRSGLKVLVEAA